MFEKVTERGRKVMALANCEAQRFNHEYIGTEHILLGLVKEGGGVGANILKNIGVDLDRVCAEVEKLIKKGPDEVAEGQLPQTPRAKKVMKYAIEEAANLNHHYVGTEHLLLGLMRAEGGIAVHVLSNLGVKLDSLREEVLNLLGAGVEKYRKPEEAGARRRVIRHRFEGEGTMISEKLVKALNDQLNAELYSAYLYLSMSGYLSSADWAGAAVWMRVQAKEESKHAMKFYDYIVEQGARVRLKEVKCPPGQWDSLLAVFEQTCKHERKVTSMIESLMELAKKAKDKETQEFLQWFVDEQVEEEEHTGNVLEQVKAAGDALAKLDTELGKRKE